MQAFGCFFIFSIVKEGKRKCVQKLILKKKSPDLFDQFVSMVEREIDIM